jgi:hypothetical protein
LRDDIWIPRDVSAEMSRDKTRVGVIPGADSSTDDKIDGLAFVELGDGRRLRQTAGRRREEHRD